ncbi:hypothetical protein CPZ30_14300 [Paenibacillus lautus]|nr:hypothetical protein CPZ30_14300 [Paenibacillus lautus]
MRQLLKIIQYFQNVSSETNTTKNPTASKQVIQFYLAALILQVHLNQHNLTKKRTSLWRCVFH